ncbi:MAG: hypothetical protein LCH92_09085 [Proteobacteria bacterium]|nr:hypothetical protein [Pseudomonadota bacterium]
MRWGWIFVALMVLVGLIPVLSLGAMTALSTLAGCRSALGYSDPCLWAGFDWSGVLHGLDIAGRFFFLTAPIALAGFVLGIALALVLLVRRARG